MQARSRAGATVLMLAIAVPVAADPITFAFTGVVVEGTAELVGQTLTGSFTYDADLATLVDTCCELGQVLQQQSATTLPGATPYAFGNVQLSGGLLVQTGAGTLSNHGFSQVIRAAGEEGLPGPMNEFNLMASSSFTGGLSSTIGLSTRDSLGTASTLFADPAGGLANDQPIRWLTPGASSTGSFSIASANVNVTQGLFTLTSVTAVPEPMPSSMLLGGLALLGATAAARQRATRST